MELNDLFVKKGVSPEQVLVLRHRPEERKLRRVLPWLAAREPDLFNAYQQTQTERVERAMMKAKHVASFIGDEAGRAVFAGLYSVAGSNPLTYDEFWKVPAHVRLKKEYGMAGFSGGRPSIFWFDLMLSDFYNEWRGRLVVSWPPPELSWWRWADRNRIPVLAIQEESIFDPAMPRWDELNLDLNQIRVLPESWKARLREWRGIYFVFDESDGKGYVGSAYGEDNLLGRWLDYGESGHGGNKLLRGREPNNFLFSILERVSPDMKPDDVIRLEGSWKERLHTRSPHGLNEN